MVLACSGLTYADENRKQKSLSNDFVIVIHGGGGVRKRDQMTAELEAAHRAALKASLQAGYDILAAGGDGISAVEAAVIVLEDSPLFNAGKGSSFNRDGVHQLDAAIMDGRTSDAGAVGVVQNVKNPITLARKIMEDTPHVMMAGEGARDYARSAGLEMVAPHYFWTERKWDSLQRRLQQGTKYGRKPRQASLSGRPADVGQWGTVGAVALDRHGNLAAATSTGGREGKLPGRIGDSPIIGAGTYAHNGTLAASSTGLGEYVIRTVSTKLMSDLMAFKAYSADDAVRESMQRVIDLGGGVGVIAVDKEGKVVMRYSGRGMYRGFVRQDGKFVTKIYKD
ncbi:isoaspartyl peptidase/L-asparaginase [Exilibacterium tricleocarpae]|uniref:Isoaspartyl peptidase n=2 Tax=Exilibacterium tricleocarpae TaxID=2591008 RepID=A0A545SS72_9GAMM|nr:isoaspartyl peptidase/L-asparaginase [Exilibacterium tricleocarpae]